MQKRLVSKQVKKILEPPLEQSEINMVTNQRKMLIICRCPRQLVLYGVVLLICRDDDNNSSKDRAHEGHESEID